MVVPKKNKFNTNRHGIRKRALYAVIRRLTGKYRSFIVGLLPPFLRGNSDEKACIISVTKVLSALVASQTIHKIAEQVLTNKFTFGHSTYALEIRLF